MRWITFPLPPEAQALDRRLGRYQHCKSPLELGKPLWSCQLLFNNILLRSLTVFQLHLPVFCGFLDFNIDEYT